MKMFLQVLFLNIKKNKPYIMLGKVDPKKIEFLLFEQCVYALEISTGEIVDFLVGTEVEVFPGAEITY